MSTFDAPTQSWSPREEFDSDPTLSLDGTGTGTGTGHPAVDEVVAVLAEAKDLPPAAQVVPLTHASRVLRETLDSIGDV